MPDVKISPGFYDGIHLRYETLNTALTLGLDRRWRRKAAREALALKPKHVLDVCCGTGNLTVELHRLSEGGTVIIGLDFSEAMLSKALEKRSGATFIRGEAGVLPFPDAAFDALTMSFAARNLDEGRRTGRGPGDSGKSLVKYFSEFRRVLKPGGIFVNLETSQPGNRLIRSVFHAAVRFLLAPVRMLSPKNKTAYGFLEQTVAAFYSPEELSKIILAAGFSEVRVLPLMFGAAAIHTAVNKS
jgi:demethylmenaquinone methyltransferase/2-methoxy-6-polyprenyl-1,4-benzoquinol methylase